jgi:rod shape-determining protein MreD
MGAAALTVWNWLRAGVVVVLALVVQESLLIHIQFDGAHPDVMMLVAVAAGFVAGAGRGPVIGFGAGIAADLFVTTPFGMTGLVGAVLAYCVAVASFSLVRTSPTLQVVAGAAGTAAGLCLYATLGGLLGYPKMLQLQLVPALVVAIPAAAILAIPVIRLMQWAMRPSPVSLRPRERSRLW